MACGEQRHELMRWSVSNICVGVLVCGGASALLSTILYKNNDAGFYNMQIKHSLCLTYI